MAKVLQCIYKSYDPVMTLTKFMARSTWVAYAFEWEKLTPVPQMKTGNVLKHETMANLFMGKEYPVLI